MTVKKNISVIRKDPVSRVKKTKLTKEVVFFKKIVVFFFNIF